MNGAELLTMMGIGIHLTGVPIAMRVAYDQLDKHNTPSFPGSLTDQDNRFWAVLTGFLWPIVVVGLVIGSLRWPIRRLSRWVFSETPTQRLRREQAEADRELERAQEAAHEYDLPLDPTVTPEIDISSGRVS